MYEVTCHKATLGNTEFKSYWCGGKLWNAGVKRFEDSEMTPELLKALEEDKVHGPGRIEVEHFEGPVPKPKAPKVDKKSDAKSDK